MNKDRVEASIYLTLVIFMFFFIVIGAVKAVRSRSINNTYINV